MADYFAQPAGILARELELHLADAISASSVWPSWAKTSS